MNETTTPNGASMERIIRTDLGNGRYRYTSDKRGVMIESSKVLYTHAALFAPGETEHGPLTFHKTAAAADKTRGATGPNGPYWTKCGVVEIEAA